MNAFLQAFAFVLNAEGGGTITDDPEDPGGLTRWGISKRSHPDLDIANLTLDEAREIYRREYWDRCSCDLFPPPLAMALFDSAVNQGPVRAIRLMQRALRVEEDGVVGPDTLAAANSVITDDLLISFLSYRASAYALLSPRFHRGWFARLFKLQRAAWSLA